jgi:5-hydroxyisourate hydrolase-like protein (transthyretin family)
MRGSLPVSRRDAENHETRGAGGSARGRARWSSGAGRWAFAAMVGCIVLLALAPSALAAGTGKIEGTVTESAHKALANVSVTVYGSGEEVEGSASTNVNGEYTVSGLSEGEYKVGFSDQPTYVNQYYDKQASFASAGFVSVIQGNTTAGIGAEMQQPGRIAGRVTNTAGTPVAGVEVEAYGTGVEFESVKTAFTDANGEYTIEGLPEGEYKVGFFPSESEYLNQYYNGQVSLPNANPVLVAAGNTAMGIDAALVEGGKISGTVTDAYTHIGLGKIRVFAYIPSGEFGVGGASTNASGQYTITGLPAGVYKVEFSWEYSEAERKACEHAPRCPPRYITQYYSNQPSEATANPVTATDGAVTAAINAAMVPSAPFNTVAPSVSGTPTVGSLLSCASGSWTGEPELALSLGWPLTTPFTYQWLRDGGPIAGASSDAHVVQAADVGHTLVCEVTATNVAGRASAKSNALAIVKPVPSVRTLALKLAVAKNATKVSIVCANASCSGLAEVVEQVVSKHGKGGKSKQKTIVLAKGSYSLAAGKTGAVTLRLTSAGKKRLAHAHRHRTSAKLVITVTGGKQIEKTVLLSL